MAIVLVMDPTCQGTIIKMYVMKKLFRITSILLMVFLSVSSVKANWSDPTVVVSAQRILLGSTLSVDYYNAPSGASLVAYPLKGSAILPAASVSIASTKGTASLTIPQSAGSHGYYVALITGSGSTVKVVSDPVLIVADAVGSGFEMTAGKTAYSRGETISMSFKGAPACSGDAIALYPASYTLVPAGNSTYQAPTAQADVSASTGSVSLSTTVSGYYKAYYLLEGRPATVFGQQDLLVGTPMTIRATASKYTPEQNVEITYSGASKVYPDWIGIYKTTDVVTTTPPLYKVSLLGHSSGTAVIPAGTLDVGTYKVAGFYNNSTSASSAYIRVRIAAGDNDLALSNDSVETYYTIASPTDGLVMAADAGNTAAAKSMKLATAAEGDYTQQWKLVKREDGKLDIINRSTGDYLLTTSTASGNFNFTKIGTPGTNNGWRYTLLDADKGYYALYSTEEDGIQRYLANATMGSAAERLDLKNNTHLYWTFTPAETVVTGIGGVRGSDTTVTVSEGFIRVSGDQSYTLWDAFGIQQPRDRRLQAGVYLLRWTDGRTAKVRVR